MVLGVDPVTRPTIVEMERILAVVEIRMAIEIRSLGTHSDHISNVRIPVSRRTKSSRRRRRYANSDRGDPDGKRMD